MIKNLLIGLLLTGLWTGAYCNEVNLVKEQYWAIPTGSDSIDHNYNNLPHCFADGKPDTAWITGLDMLEHEAQVRWRNNLVTVKRLELDFKPVAFRYSPPRNTFGTRGKISAKNLKTKIPDRITVFLKIAGKWRNFEPAIKWTKKDYAVITFKNPAKDVDCLRVSFNGKKADDLFALHELKVFGAVQTDTFKFRPDWKARWIWQNPEPYEANYGIVKRYFRRIFRIEDPSKIIAAKLLFVAHDRGTVFLNGKQIAKTVNTGSGTRQDCVRVNLSPDCFKQGMNLLAIEGEDIEEIGLRGVLAELAVKFKNGSVQYIPTNIETWSANYFKVPGWNTRPVLADKWPRPIDIRTASEKYFSLWSVEYTPQFFDGSCQILSLRMQSGTPIPGERFKIFVKVKVEKPLKSAYGAMLDFGEHGPLNVTKMDYSLGSSLVVPEIGLPKGFKGTKELCFEGVWPEGTPPRVSAVLRLCNKGSMLKIVPGSVGEVTSGFNPGGLKVFLGKAEHHFCSKGFPTVKIDGNGRLQINGKPVSPIVYTSSLQTLDNLQKYMSTGINIFRIMPLHSDRLIPADDDEDSHIKRFVDTVKFTVSPLIAMNPDAKFLLQISLDLPNEWKINNPEETIVLGSGQRLINKNARDSSMGFYQESTASKAVYAKVYRAVKKFIEQLNAEPCAEHIIGVFFAHGRAGENIWGLDNNQYIDSRGRWVISGRDEMTFGDFSLAARRSFVQWLEKKYKTRENLEKAWKVKNIAFKDILSSSKWPCWRFNRILMWRDKKANQFMFRDSIKEGAVYSDFVEHHNETRARLFMTAGKAVKDASGGKLLAGGYIGYSINMITNSPPALSQHSGHCAFKQLMDSPYIDWLSSPHFYSMRRRGMPVMPYTTVDSLKLHGKIWMNEFDCSTFSSWIRGKTFSKVETAEVLKKEFAAAVTDGQGWWWYEFPFALAGRKAAGGFTDDTLLKDAAIMKKIYNKQIDYPAGPRAEIAVIFNVEQAYYTDAYAPANSLHACISNQLIPKMQQIGAPYDIYAQSDLKELVDKKWYKHYKLIWFVNSFHISPETRKLIERLKSDNRTLAFVYAPGYQGNAGENTECSVKGIEEIIGMKGIKIEPRKALFGAFFGNNPYFSNEVPRRYDCYAWNGGHALKYYGNELGPIFYLDNKKRNKWTTIASLRLDKKLNPDKTAVALKKFKDYSILYSVIPDLPTPFLRNVARLSGVHLFSSKPYILTYANRNIVAVHSGEAVKGLILSNPVAVNWYEPFEQKMYAVKTKDIKLDLKKGQTKVFVFNMSNKK
jgi:hypothetical protein